VVDNPEFRTLILYLGNTVGLKDTDIPHRSKALTLIKNEYDSKYQSLKNDLKVCLLYYAIPDTRTYCMYQDALGRVSLTSDMWSDLNRRSFMAVTAHWMAKGRSNHLELRSALVAFQEVNGSHSGDNMGQVLFDIIQDIGIAHRVCIHAFTPEK